MGLTDSERSFMQAGRDAGYSDDEIVAKVKERRAAAPKQLPPDQITKEELYALKSSPESLKASLEPTYDASPETAKPMFPDAIWNSPDPIGKAKQNFSEGAHTVGHMLTNAANAATLGYYGKARHAIGNLIAPDANAAANEDDTRRNQEQPFTSNLGTATGYLVGAPELLARGASSLVGAGARAIGPAAEGFIGKTLGGAATGALSGGGIAASEAASGGGDATDIGNAATRGGAFGAALGGGFGAAEGGLAKLAEGADKRITERNIADFTEGATAGRRDKVVGKGGEKADRIDKFIRRTTDFEGTNGDPVKQLPIVEHKIEETGLHLDGIYSGVKVHPTAITGPMRQMAAEIRGSGMSSPTEAAAADAMEAEASRIEEGSKGSVDARTARSYITKTGKALFKGNPNVDPAEATGIRQKLYGRLTDSLGQVVESVKPGVRAELTPLNQEMSDLLNMHDAVQSRASRAQTPSMSLASRLDHATDTVLGVMHPGHFAMKKAVQRFGPGAMRGLDDSLAMGGAPLPVQAMNPLSQAYARANQEHAQAAQQQAQQEAAQQEMEANVKRTKDAVVYHAIFSKQPEPDSQQQE